MNTRRFRWWRVVGVSATLLMAGCAIFGDAPEILISQFDVHGEPAEFVAYRSDTGLCTEARQVADPDNPWAAGCGMDLPEGKALGVMLDPVMPDGPDGGVQGLAVSGTVAKDATQLRVKLEDGQVVNVEPVGMGAGFDVNFFVKVLPPTAEVRSLSALSDDGRVLEEHSVVP